MLTNGLIGVFAASVMIAPGASAPAGWTSAAGANGATVYTPGDLQTGEVFTVTVYAPQKNNGKPLADWLLAFAGNDGDGETPKAENNSNGLTVVSRPFRGADGSQQAHLYTANASADGAVRVVRITFSLATQVFPRYKDAANRIVRETLSPGQSGTVKTAKTGGTGKAMLGGKLLPGLYVGKQYSVSGSKRELIGGIRLYIYPNGEYRVNDENDKPFKYNTGTVGYDAKSGKLNIDNSFRMANSRTDPERDFCFYGSGKDGTRVIVAEEYRGYGTIKTALGYAGETKTQSPTATKATEAAAKAEEARYKFVTAPGKGVQPGQIATILHEYDVQMYSMGASGMGTNITDEAYLLLKDGTVHKGLPVPADTLDVAASRRGEPKKWGKWRRNGNGYQIALAGGAFKKLDATPVLAVGSGARLSGRYGTGSSSASLMGSSYALWGVTFTKDGRFKKDGRGGSGNSLFMQTGGAPAINSTYDDNGSVTSVLGADTTVMAKRKNNPNGDKEGTYSISGYTMILRYDNGTTARLPFFYTQPNKSTVYFEGNQLAFDDGKD
ncbi:MAG: hypothetical protein H7Y38_08680 [Armatimonadetes bacterium]|nr:hypothetical protein [Armatimonadota bacterium]